MKNKIKNLIVFGTRPEAIKMAPLVKELQKHSEFETKVCVTAQHREMLDQVLDFFEIEPDYDLDLMKPGQNLFDLTTNILTELRHIISEFQPNYVFVHGDTTTTMAASLCSFYSGVKVVHVEAGLRTYDKLAPFPEEINRQITSRIADLHFAPTIEAKDNLLNEKINESLISVTGNTVVDALLYSSEKVKSYKNEEIIKLKNLVASNKKVVLVTGHRRENQGGGFEKICRALKYLAENNPDIQIIYPVHLNPAVKNVVHEILEGVKNISLIAPLSYPSFVWLMNQSYIIITDSGGIQEEAPSLGKPVLVLRETTERPEAVKAGTVVLVGTNEKRIIEMTEQLLNNSESYKRMSELHNPYGDGNACKRIVEFLKEQIY